MSSLVNVNVKMVEVEEEAFSLTWVDSGCVLCTLRIRSVDDGEMGNGICYGPSAVLVLVLMWMFDIFLNVHVDVDTTYLPITSRYLNK